MKYFIEVLESDLYQNDQRPGLAQKEFRELDHPPLEGSCVFIERDSNEDLISATVVGKPEYLFMDGTVRIYCVLDNDADKSSLTPEKGWRVFD